MRTLYEIIESAKDGNKPTHEECYWAMLAYSALLSFSASDIRKLTVENPSPLVKSFLKEEHHKRLKGALGNNPKDYVGWNNDPANPEYQKMRQIGSKLVNKIIEKDTK